PQYVHSDQFAERGENKIGMLIEGAPVFPMSLGSFFPSFGEEKQDLMQLLPHMSLTGVLLHDGFDLNDENEGGHVTLTKTGRPRFDYRFSSRMQEGLKTGVEIA